MRLGRRALYFGFLLMLAAAVGYLTWRGHPPATATVTGPILPRRPFPTDGLRKTSTLLTWWGWLLALAAAPGAWRLARVEKPALRFTGLAILVASGAIVATISERYFASRWLGVPMIPLEYLLVPVPLTVGAVPFVVMVLVVFLIETRDREILLRAQLAESRLGALTAQMQPHFLFNTLQAISSALHRDPVAADRMVGGLADLLRSALEGSRSPVVSLGHEVELLNAYVGIMRERFGDRVTVRIDVAPGLATAEVPVLLLQPLVENAFRHGVETREGAAEIRVSARSDGPHLVLQVRDDGIGPFNAPVPAGTGLGNTRERLAALYGGRARLDVAAAPGGGVTVTARIPLRERP